MKSIINDSIWEGVNNESFKVPLVYYTDKHCYISNPTEKFIGLYNPSLIYTNDKLNIYQTELLDDVPFHMAVSISYENLDDYSYKSPFMLCSSTEITNQIVRDVPSTEVWSTMILHEYFHGFQFKHDAYIDYFEQIPPQDTLRTIFVSHNWFKECIEKENNLLLVALSSQYSEKTETLINTFFELRDQRRNQLNELFSIDIKSIEQFYETMEGTARYVEAELYHILATTNDAHDTLLKSDSLYDSNSYFKNFNLENSQWLYKTNFSNSYYYVTGFNIARLLDILNIEYKSKLFTNPELSLEDILRNSLDSNRPFYNKKP